MSFLLLILFKQHLAVMLPLYPIYNNGAYDDLLMVQLADKLLNSSWPTSPVMLTKGIGFPLFLLLGVLLGFNYAVLNTLFHSAASLLMVFAVEPIIRRRWMMLIFFAILIFLPATCSLDCFQRIYRTSITIWQVLLIMASLAGMLFRLERFPGVLLKWSLPGVIGLSWMFHTREESVWIVPLAVGMFAVSFFSLWYAVSPKKREFWLKGIILLLPLLFLLVTVEIISAMNYCHNGFWGTTIFTDGPFPRMVRSIYQIRWPDSDQLSPRLAISRKQLRSLYQFSPTLAAKRKNIEQSLDHWSTGCPKPGPEKEVENGWIFWSMLLWPNEEQTVNANRFYAAVADELNSAVAAGDLKTRRTMPSALMAPWKPSALPVFEKAFWEAWDVVLNHQKIHLYNSSSREPIHGIRYLEDFSGKKIAHVSDLPSSIKVSTDSAVEILNSLIDWYKSSAAVINILGLAGFLVILIRVIYSPDIQLLKTVIFLIAIAASCTLLIAGVAYTHATSIYALHPAYLAGCYPIIPVFCLTAFFCALNILIGIWPRHRSSAKSVPPFQPHNEIR